MGFEQPVGGQAVRLVPARIAGLVMATWAALAYAQQVYAGEGPADTRPPSETPRPRVDNNEGAVGGGEAPRRSAAPGTNAEPPARNLSEAVQPLWIDLSSEQRAVLAPFAEQWNTWPADDKAVWVRLATRFPGFSPPSKEKAERRIREWAALSPAERVVARHNFQLARKRNHDQRGKEWQRYQEMTPEQRAVLRNNGALGNTAAGRSAPSGLAREAAQPLSIEPVSNRRAEQ